MKSINFKSKESIADFIDSHLKELGGEAYGSNYIAEKIWEWHINSKETGPDDYRIIENSET